VTGDRLQRCEGWLAAPAPPERLAAFRILTGTFVVLYLVIRLDPFLDSAEIAQGSFDPVGVWAWLDRPLEPLVVRGLLVVTLITGLLYTTGTGFRVSGPIFAVTLLAVTSYRSSGGQLLYFENLAVLHVLIVGVAPAADAFALRTGTPRRPPHARYGWPLRLAALVTVVTYVLAAMAKLRIGGSGWLDGESLRNHVAFSAARLELLGASASPLARPITRFGWLFTPLAWATLVIEFGAPVALFRRWRSAWVAAVWALHAGIALTMFVVFPYPLTLVAFAPMFALEDGVARARRLVDRR
jgi:hypothetical protein